MKRFSNDTECFRRLKRTPHLLVGVLTGVVLLVSSLSVVGLYIVGFNEQKNRLVEIVQSRASMIEVIAEHAMHEHRQGKISLDSKENVLDKLMHSQARFAGFGESGEFALAQREGDSIVFLLRHRHTVNDASMRIPWDANLAEPMRRALAGHAGTIIGLDYRGERVVAAYEPLGILGWGIVAKMDVSEIRQPYIDASLIVLASVIF